MSLYSLYNWMNKTRNNIFIPATRFHKLRNQNKNDKNDKNDKVNKDIFYKASDKLCSYSDDIWVSDGCIIEEGYISIQYEDNTEAKKELISNSETKPRIVSNRIGKENPNRRVIYRARVCKKHNMAGKKN